jgi:hypothetical protein
MSNIPTPAADLAAKALAPILIWVEGERGRKAEFVRRVQEAASPANLTRNLVESWIHPDPTRRTQPLLPNGLLLLEVARQMKITTPPTPQ